MRRPPHVRLTALAAALTLTACGDTVGPNPAVAGTYHLEQINGLRLPARFASNRSSVPTYTVLSGTLALGVDGRYALATEQRIEDPLGGTYATAPSDRGSWAQRGDTVVTITDRLDEGSAARYVVAPAGTLTLLPPPQIVTRPPSTIYRRR